MQLTSEQIRTRGLQALRRALGRAGMVEFLQQFDKGSGDYTRDRRKWVNQISVEDIMAQAAGVARKRRSTKRSA